MLDCEAYGLNAAGHHTINLFLHAANTVLLYALLRRLTGALWRSAVVAALFALHPIHVESVAWVAERKDVLSLFFGLLCLHAYVSYATERSCRFEEPDGCDDETAPRVRKAEALSGQTSGVYYTLTLLLFAFALMSKPMLVTLPLLMLLLDFWPLSRFELSTLNYQSLISLVREKLPLFLLSAASCLITFQVQKAGGAVAGLQQLPLAARISNSIVSYLRYLGKLFWPSDLAILYPFRAWPLSLVLLTLLILILVTLLTIWQRQKRPYLFVGWAWYMVSLVPVIGLVQVGAQSIADRYTYLPCIGLCFALVWTVADAFGGRRSGKVALFIGATASVLVLAGLTQKQISFWQNTESLFTHAVSVTSRNALSYNTLGRYFATFYEWRQAEESYRTAIKIDPGFQQAWNNLGCALIDQGRNEEAITNCLIAIQLGSSFAEAHNNLGTALLNLGKTDQAIEAYAQALKLRPEYEQAHYNLGNALALQGRIPEARQQYQAALEINPRSASAHNNCGFMLAKEGKFSQATNEFSIALALNPALWQAHFGLGDALARLGQHAAAAAEFTELLKTHPNNAAAQSQLEICQGHMRSADVDGLQPRNGR